MTSDNESMLMRPPLTPLCRRRSPAISFRPCARTYANGDITYYLRDHGFAIKVPPSWQDLYASGQKLLQEGLHSHAIPERMGITAERWQEIQDACSITVIALQPDA